MKLYATVESERAKKGQGGNKYVFASFSVEREPVGEVELELMDDGEWLLKYRANDLMDWDILRQGSIDIKKTIAYHCEMHAWHCSGDGAYPCPHHQRSEKGKQQKGDDDFDRCKKCGSTEKDGYESLCYDCQMKS